MKMGSPSDQTVLIFGGDSFTGRHLTPLLQQQGYDVHGTSRKKSAGTGIHQCDITVLEEVRRVLEEVGPSFVVVLAGLSFVAHEQPLELYQTNVFGPLNVLQACRETGTIPRKIILASSAAVYGRREGALSEDLCPAPVNHYGASKLCMEHLAWQYFEHFNIVIARPFNYTGPGQGEKFVIPKIVSHYQRGAQRIELGNIDVVREFNDVRDVANIYAKLLISRSPSTVVNICTGRGYSLRQVLTALEQITGTGLEVTRNPDYVRAHDIAVLTGDSTGLKKVIGDFSAYTLQDTLKSMLMHG
jgi:nucleoside-diphosphate-sugar epimerase